MKVEITQALSPLKRERGEKVKLRPNNITEQQQKGEFENAISCKAEVTRVERSI